MAAKKNTAPKKTTARKKRSAKKKEKPEVLRTDVLIVGGGLAGLTAAVGLSDSGVDTIVVEKDQILGGRAQSWIDKKTGDSVSIGPHIFITEYPNMRKFLRLLGTEDKIVWQPGKFINIVEGQETTEVRLAPYPAPFHFAYNMLEGGDYFELGDVLTNLRVTLFAFQMNEEDVDALDNINASAFLRSMGVNERSIERFWSFSCMAIMNVPIEICSAGSLMRFYRRMMGSKGYTVGFADGGLGDLFAPQAQARIEGNGSRVMLDTEVKCFTGDDSHVTGVELADGRRIEARFTIAALPPAALRALSRRNWVRGLKPFSDLVNFHPSPYVSTYIWFDRKITDKQFWARKHDPNDLNCDFYDYSNIYTDRSNPNSLITTNCIFCERAAHMTDEEIVEETLRELAEYIPAALEAKVVHTLVNRIPMAIHCPFPGTERLRPPVRTPVKNLFLTGDWIRTGLPSSMESACAAGWMVAEEILTDLGRRRVLTIKHKELEGVADALNRISAKLPGKTVPKWLGPARALGADLVSAAANRVRGLF